MCELFKTKHPRYLFLIKTIKLRKNVREKNANPCSIRVCNLNSYPDLQQINWEIEKNLESL
jgi:hypothetical protein